MSSRPTKVVMASGNAGKIREIARLLDGLGVEVIAQTDLGVDDADETGTTFAENSLIKARHAAEATGLPSIADDSGLSVDALDGAPGVYSARYAGDAGDEANNDKLLAALDGIEDRGAAFHCVATFVEPGDGASRWLRRASGAGRSCMPGRAAGGFGYDPVFFVPDWEPQFGGTDARGKKRAQSSRPGAARSWSSSSNRSTA